LPAFLWRGDDGQLQEEIDGALKIELPAAGARLLFSERRRTAAD
jgi:hypothetical protein